MFLDKLNDLGVVSIKCLALVGSQTGSGSYLRRSVLAGLARGFGHYG